ncbi:MAG: 3-oxoacyl-ACP synthase [Acidobacteria bacterium]|nr:3-oxoacyl-ACP synthase [Acidobacteriota bacterium]
MGRLRRVSEREIRETSPAELANLPGDFWDHAKVVEPTAKQPISLRVDEDVLTWFKTQGPRYQSRMNAVLRSFMAQRRVGTRHNTG